MGQSKPRVYQYHGNSVSLYSKPMYRQPCRPMYIHRLRYDWNPMQISDGLSMLLAVIHLQCILLLGGREACNFLAIMYCRNFSDSHVCHYIKGILSAFILGILSARWAFRWHFHINPFPSIQGISYTTTTRSLLLVGQVRGVSAAHPYLKKIQTLCIQKANKQNNGDTHK